MGKFFFSKFIFWYIWNCIFVISKNIWKEFFFQNSENGAWPIWNIWDRYVFKNALKYNVLKNHDLRWKNEREIRKWRQSKCEGKILPWTITLSIRALVTPGPLRCILPSVLELKDEFLLGMTCPANVYHTEHNLSPARPTTTKTPDSPTRHYGSLTGGPHLR